MNKFVKSKFSFVNFNEFKNKIPLLKSSELGGLDAQFRLAPKLRLKYDADKIRASNPRKAAVLALFFPNKNRQNKRYNRHD